MVCACGLFVWLLASWFCWRLVAGCDLQVWFGLVGLVLVTVFGCWFA